METKKPIMPALSIDTPTGPFTVWETDDAITRAGWAADHADPTPLLMQAARQITDYFNGTLERFDLPLRVKGTDTQRRICDAIAAIPFGETRTYGELAHELGLPAQAVGQGCGGNPIPLLIPCHRVLGANSLGGFSGTHGVETKVWLLKHERAAGLLI